MLRSSCHFQSNVRTSNHGVHHCVSWTHRLVTGATPSAEVFPRSISTYVKSRCPQRPGGATCQQWSLRRRRNLVIHTPRNHHTHAVVASVIGCSWGATRSYCDASSTTSFGNTGLVEAERKTTGPRQLQRQGQHVSWKTLLGKIRRVYRMLRRCMQLMITLSPVVVFYPLVLLYHRNREEGAHKDVHEVALQADRELHGFLRWYYNTCLHCVELSGAAVIKLMQWAGSRPDLFGHDFCTVFSKLQDNTTPHHHLHTAQMLLEAYGEDWQEKIALGPIIGSGCIGQVYKGTIQRNSDDGATTTTTAPQDVAIKVMHPNVKEDIDADLDLMRFAVRAIQYLPFEAFANLKWLDPEGIVEEFAKLLKIQLDLRLEAKNLIRFNENFKQVEGIIFPELIEEYEPSKNVLIETYLDGIPIIQYAKKHKHDKKKLTHLCNTAIKAVCKMIFLDNFMHGDLHPGNIVITHDHKFALYDVGIVAEYSEADHQLIVDILAAFIRKQGDRAGELLIDQSNERMEQFDECAIEQEQFIHKIHQLTLRAAEQGYLMEQLGTYITYICDAASTHHVMINPSFVSAALAVKIQEGIALALDPGAQVYKVAIPIIYESERKRGQLKYRVAEYMGIDKLVKRFTKTAEESKPKR